MKRFAAVTGISAAIGMACGALARLSMRLISLISGDDPEFSLGATTGIVSFFVIASVGGGWGGLIRRRPWGIALALLATFPIALLGTAIGAGDLAQRTDEPLSSLVPVVALSIIIAACVVAAPMFAWRSSIRRNRAHS